MMRIIFALVILSFVIGCKSKKTKSDVPVENFFVSDYLKGQVARLDTASYTFQKIDIVDTLSDTSEINNSEVRRYAQDFLSLPDLSKDGLKDDYQVDHLYDDLQGAFVFTYSTKEAHPIREQHVTVEPEINKEGKNDIRSVYVDYWDIKQQDVSIRKKMMWEANDFYIITSTEKPGAPEQIKTVKVIWNGFDSSKK